MSKHKGMRFSMSIRKQDIKILEHLQRVEEEEQDKSNFIRTMMMYGFDFCQQNGIEITPDLGYYNFLGMQNKPDPVAFPATQPSPIKPVEIDGHDPVVIEEKVVTFASDNEEDDLFEKMSKHY